MKKIILSICSIGLAMTLAAETLPYSLRTDEPIEYFGYGKAETYDVAIFVPGDGLEGKQISGVCVAIPSGADLSDAKGWLSSTLELKRDNGKYINQPNICTADAEISGGKLIVTFDTPYTLTSEGVYVGYSFTTQAGCENAVAVIRSTHKEGFWMHATRSKIKWASLSAETGLSSALEVMITGDFADNAALLSVEEIPVVSLEGESFMKANIVNYGLKPINSIKYIYTTPARSGKGEINLNTPLCAMLGASAPVDINIGQLSETGINEISLTVTDVNDTANTLADYTNSFKVKAIPFVPVNRPLFEEYTGLWCGYCPRGYVALETMKERYGDIFVGIAYHQGDAMTFIDSTPNSPGDGLPSSFINRSKEINPGDIYSLWSNYRSSIPAAGINSEIELTGNAGSDIKAKSTVRFIENYSSSDFRISYVLIADGLYNNDWEQTNYYAGHTHEEYPNMPEPWGDIFLNGPKTIKGLIFNDVAVAASDFAGIAGSLPSEIVAGEEYSHTYTFKMEDLKASGAANVINDFGKLRVVAIVKDNRKGQYVNCISSAYLDGSVGVQAEAEETSILHTEYYDLCGCRILNPEKGIFLRIDTYSDGSHKTQKIVL